MLPERLAGSVPHPLSQIKLFVTAWEEENTSGRGFAAWQELTFLSRTCTPLGAAEDFGNLVLLATNWLLRRAKQTHRLWLVQQQSKFPNWNFFPPWKKVHGVKALGGSCFFAEVSIVFDA